ncbi:hypothetical protein T492DRAFT_223888 [Pavlovales sp. CCMP2436]|nr:hypothetical protein T492DRAFT_223888 [Pavlovales sp. CCMP2436]
MRAKPRPGEDPGGGEHLQQLKHEDKHQPPRCTTSPTTGRPSTGLRGGNPSEYRQIRQAQFMLRCHAPRGQTLSGGSQHYGNAYETRAGTVTPGLSGWTLRATHEPTCHRTERQYSTDPLARPPATKDHINPRLLLTNADCKTAQQDICTTSLCHTPSNPLHRQPRASSGTKPVEHAKSTIGPSPKFKHKALLAYYSTTTKDDRPYKLDHTRSLRSDKALNHIHGFRQLHYIRALKPTPNTPKP